MRILRTLAATLLTAALVLTCAACLAEAAEAPWPTLGEGAQEATLILVLSDQSTRGYHLRSDRDTLLQALQDLNLVQVDETDAGLRLVAVDGVPLPGDQPEAYWFIAMLDPATDALVAAQLPLDQLPFPGQTYAMGIISE